MNGGSIDKAQRREELKFRLEVMQTLISVLGLLAIIFAGLEWRESNQAATQEVYGRMTAEWNAHLKLLFENPDLRPYFEENQPLTEGDKDRSKVLAYADLRLDIMDAILTYPALRGFEQEIKGWRNTVDSAFRASPVLCGRFNQTKTNFGQIVEIGQSACRN